MPLGRYGLFRKLKHPSRADQVCGVGGWCRSGSGKARTTGCGGSTFYHVMASGH